MGSNAGRMDHVVNKWMGKWGQQEILDLRLSIASYVSFFLNYLFIFYLALLFFFLFVFEPNSPLLNFLFQGKYFVLFLSNIIISIAIIYVTILYIVQDES